MASIAACMTGRPQPSRVSMLCQSFCGSDLSVAILFCRNTSLSDVVIDGTTDAGCTQLPWQQQQLWQRWQRQRQHELNDQSQQMHGASLVQHEPVTADEMMQLDCLCVSSIFKMNVEIASSVDQFNAHSKAVENRCKFVKKLWLHCFRTMTVECSDDGNRLAGSDAYTNHFRSGYLNIDDNPQQDYISSGTDHASMIYQTNVGNMRSQCFNDVKASWLKPSLHRTVNVMPWHP